jgi:hypothetical protein
MKIRKFNENVDDEIRYIEECLVELYDSYDVKLHNDLTYITITIEIPVSGFSYDHENYGFNLLDFISISEKLSNIKSIVEDGVSKLDTRYNYKYSFDIFKNEGEDELYYFNMCITRNDHL